MIRMGCDFHPGGQQVCRLDPATGETEESKLVHAAGEAERNDRGFAAPTRIGPESTGNCQWFAELVEGMGHQVWIGDAGEIRACEVRQPKHDRREARHLLRLLKEGRYPRIGCPRVSGRISGSFRFIGTSWCASARR
jgi:transposase